MKPLEKKLKALQQISQRKLIDILNKIPGSKELIIDPVLLKPFELVTGMSVLRSHGIQKVHRLDSNDKDISTFHVVYLAYIDVTTMQRICEQIQGQLRRNKEHLYHVICVPYVLASSQHLLEEEGLYGVIKLYPFLWELMKIDNHLFSLELNNIFRTLFIEGDRSLLCMIAHSIWTLTFLLGKFPLILTHGRFSHQIYTLYKMLGSEYESPAMQDSEIECLILVDRDVDYATPLLTSVTYTSLLDEIFGITSGTVKFDNRVTGNEKSITYRLNSADSVYSEMKNRHFSDVYSYFSNKSNELHAVQEKCKNMNIQDLKTYVPNELKKVAAMKRSLCYHIGASEVIIGALGHRFEALHRLELNMLEGKNRKECVQILEQSMIIQEDSLLRSLRFMSLFSLTQGGLYQDEATCLINQFVHNYGHKYGTAFSNLEKLGLFSVHSSGSLTTDAAGKLADRVAQVVSLPKRGSAFFTLAQKLKLFPQYNENYDLKQPSDIGYVFSGAYIPVICQLVQFLIKQDMHIDDIVKLLPGLSIKCEASSYTKVKPRKFLVYFIGGVTFAEIAAFQLLEKLLSATIIVAGTSIINGSTLVQSAL